MNDSQPSAAPSNGGPTKGGATSTGGGSATGGAGGKAIRIASARSRATRPARRTPRVSMTSVNTVSATRGLGLRKYLRRSRRPPPHRRHSLFRRSPLESLAARPRSPGDWTEHVGCVLSWFSSTIHSNIDARRTRGVLAVYSRKTPARVSQIVPPHDGSRCAREQRLSRIVGQKLHDRQRGRRRRRPRATLTLACVTRL